MLDKCFDIAREHDRNKRKDEVCWELLLVIGFNTGLRISDIRRFRVKDLRDKDYAETEAQKTGKTANILINPTAKRDLKRLLAGRRADEYILPSRTKDPMTHKARPITRQRAYQILNEIAREAGIQERIGCHTLRKTFGYHYYRQFLDVVSLQRMLQHTSKRDTLVYIGAVQEQDNENMRKFGIGGRRRRS